VFLAQAYAWRSHHLYFTHGLFYAVVVQQWLDSLQ
jgi:hypothetical protein